MTDANYSEPLLAAQRALHRASELAAERRYEEATGSLAAVIARASEAYGIVMRLADAERDRERLQAAAGTDG